MFEICSSEGLSFKNAEMVPWEKRAKNITTVFFFFLTLNLVVTDKFIYSIQEKIEAADKLNYFSVF